MVKSIDQRELAATGEKGGSERLIFTAMMGKPVALCCDDSLDNY